MTDLAHPFSPLVISVLGHPRFCYVYWSAFLCLPGGPVGHHGDSSAGVKRNLLCVGR